MLNSLFIIPWLISSIFCTTNQKAAGILFLVIIMSGFLPVVSANPEYNAFPDITFKVFNDFIQGHFGSHISLATVLTLVFSLTSNPDLLNLHAHQQHPKAQGEIHQSNSGWIKALAHALENRLENATDSLFRSEEVKSRLSDEQVTNSIGVKLDSLSKILDLHPYTKRGVFRGQLKPISDKDIEPVHVICPVSVECETVKCQSHAILKQTRERDTPKAILIKGTKIYESVPVLAGQCPQCQTGYHADHECSHNAENTWMKLYLNSAKYLKVGQNIWVDHTFSGAVLNGIYNFHASVTAFAEFWNMSFWSTQWTNSRKVSCCQVWQAFIQESV